MEYSYSGVSLQNGRSSNMDSLLLKYRKIDNSSALLAVVCDGVGSLPEGAFASGVATRMLAEWLDNIIEIERIGLKMRDAVLAINAIITTEARQRTIQTASTLSVLLLLNGSYHIAHIGDSRIYSLDSAILSQLTNDDVTESGKLSAYIGQSENITLQYSEGAARDKTFLVCSDGLYKRMDSRFMAANMNANNVRLAKESVKILTKHVIDQGEQDNITVALVKIVD